MGIKGIYGEIGPGERIALSKLAIDKFEETGRPLRIAIDISIWQFQIQAGQGGSNPAIRTFYYRLLRLLSISVQPLFVFDGPNKPPFKRNKRSGHHGASIPSMMCKQLLKLFGFPCHIAPGEAEAECAYLQREGIVDAVLSEDVDTLMFGCGTTLRNWSAEAARGNKSPTHVSVYDAKATKEGKAGLDREGMVLVALMSGGDYITEGIPGCGIKVACEAARAGFGKSLCKLLRADTAGWDAWRKNLARELQSNESKYFRCKHKSLTIPDQFPNKEVLGYYTHPVVSTAARIEKVKNEIMWDGEIDIPGLRLFVAEAFDWTNKIGARKFIRGLAPALLVQKLRLRGDRRSSGYGDVILMAMQEMELVRAICGKRVHFSTDGTPELRVVYHPNDIVGLDLDAEHDDNEDYGRDGLAPVNDDDQIEAYVSDDGATKSPFKRAASVYDPTQPDKLWILETIVKIGIPLKVEDFEESLRNPRKFIKAKAVAKKAATRGGTQKGAMEKFVKVSKPSLEDTYSTKSKSPRRTTVASSQPTLPPVYPAPTLERISSQIVPETPAKSTAPRNSRTRTVARLSRDGEFLAPKAGAKSRTRRKAVVENLSPIANPSNLTQPSPSTSTMPTITKPHTRYEGQGIMAFFRKTTPELSTSPPSAASSSSQVKKREQSPQKENTHEDLTSIPYGNTSANVPLNPSIHERTLSSPRKKSTPHTPPTLDLPSPSNPTSTPEPVNRRIDLLTPSACECSSSPALPSLQNIFSQSPESGGREREIISISSSPEVLRASRINTLPRRRHDSEKNGTEVSKGKAWVELEEDDRDGDGGGKEHTDMGVDKDKGKKYIILRESLPGGWKVAGENEEQLENARRGGRAWRISQIEVSDLREV